MNESPLTQFVVSCVENHMPYREACNEFRRAWLHEALKRNGNNRCALAEEIGVHRNTVSRFIQSLHVQIPEGKRKPRH
jgi:DNA-binding NtrC family response regulator